MTSFTLLMELADSLALEQIYRQLVALVPKLEACF